MNDVGERLAGEPHEPFEGEGLDTDARDHGRATLKTDQGNQRSRTLPAYRRTRSAPTQSLTRLPHSSVLAARAALLPRLLSQVELKRPGFDALLVMCERPVGRHGLCSSRLRARLGV